MSVGLLIISHDRIGATLLNTATTLLGFCPLGAETLTVPLDSDPDAVGRDARDALKRLDQGDGVLVLTDMYGSTPSNIATRLQQDGRVAVIAGVNLPMLVRILNYPRLGLADLTHKALSGGSEGVFVCRREAE